MHIQFNINYNTIPGQDIFLVGNIKELGSFDIEKAISLKYISNGNWIVDITLLNNITSIKYYYFLIDENNKIHYETGGERIFNINNNFSDIKIIDSWRDNNYYGDVFKSSVFSKAIFNSTHTPTPYLKIKKHELCFNLSESLVPDGFKLCIIGNNKKLGNWGNNAPLVMDYIGDGLWQASVKYTLLPNNFEYKYALYNTKNKNIEYIEEGSNRFVNYTKTENTDIIYIIDNYFRFKNKWKGAGVAIPVFSLRTYSGFGIGEFSDLLLLIDWAKKVNLKIIQLLPINDTTSYFDWRDSYPYNSISSIALHPIYLNIEKIGKLKDNYLINEFNKLKDTLNSKESIDYPEVIKCKNKFFRYLYNQDKHDFLNNEEYKKFFKDNKQWLIPYAAFSVLRDKYKTTNMQQWGEFKNYNPNKINKFLLHKSEYYNDTLFYFFIQYHCHLQLKEVSDYAHSKGIALKADIPIGINPKSVEAWIEPDLFNLNTQAGAPPDAFSENGQNWGFPTYNWDAMAKDDYSWWKNRFIKMAEYFDAYRIDHILGFFRIWEIPMSATKGLMGHFNPALPLTKQDIEKYGITFDYNRFINPYITNDLLISLLGEKTEQISKLFFYKKDENHYVFKEEFNTQRKIVDYFSSLDNNENLLCDILLNLISNVLFLQTAENEFHPAINMHNTYSFEMLDANIKSNMTKLYFDFFYKKHNEFWSKKAIAKLPHIIKSTNMLPCGEDLGMIPDCVAPVMQKLNILSLEIQRMSKNSDYQFVDLNNVPYLSVCSPSTHDMPTLRGWWEEDKNNSQFFYNSQLKQQGEAPKTAEPIICEQIIAQHLNSNSILAIFPIQDLLAMDKKIKQQTSMEIPNVSEY